MASIRRSRDPELWRPAQAKKVPSASKVTRASSPTRLWRSSMPPRSPTGSELVPEDPLEPLHPRSLNSTNFIARESDYLPNLLQCPRFPTVKAEPQQQHLSLKVIEGRDERTKLLRPGIVPTRHGSVSRQLAAEGTLGPGWAADQPPMATLLAVTRFLSHRAGSTGPSASPLPRRPRREGASGEGPPFPD